MDHKIRYNRNNYCYVGIAWLPLDTSRDDPWKLLRRAQSNNQHERLVAVSALASKHHWAGKLVHQQLVSVLY